MVPPVRILLFATAREAVGRPELEWPVPAAGMPARALVAELVRQYPPLEPIARVSRFVRNGHYLGRTSEVVHPGDEFAVHPPYSGG
jgi:molybdopterin converting factor small subunit